MIEDAATDQKQDHYRGAPETDFQARERVEKENGALKKQNRILNRDGAVATVMAGLAAVLGIVMILRNQLQETRHEVAMEALRYAFQTQKAKSLPAFPQIAQMAVKTVQDTDVVVQVGSPRVIGYSSIKARRSVFLSKEFGPGTIITVMDESGQASAKTPIVIDTWGLIDGQQHVVIDRPYQARSFVRTLGNDWSETESFLVGKTSGFQLERTIWPHGRQDR